MDQLQTEVNHWMVMLYTPPTGRALETDWMLLADEIQAIPEEEPLF